MNFIPVSDPDRQRMLETIGVDSVADLFSTIPEQNRCRSFHLPRGKSELAVNRHLDAVEAKTLYKASHLSFLGGGIYEHYIPPAVDAVISRGDFFTAYTPYQAEVSQGTLQAIFEFQTLVCQLSGMDVANASHYDGGNALAAACEMIFQQARKKKRILYARGIHPNYLEIIRTQFRSRDFTFEPLPQKDGRVDVAAAAEMVDDLTAGIIFQTPGYTGLLEDTQGLVALAKERKLLTAVSQNPLSLAIMPRPGELGVDIYTGEGQPLGIPMGFGGPGLGLMACRESLMRKMPGRIVGETVDTKGRKGYVLTLQAREQHIRREKASSNICSNQALCALAATVYLSLVGGTGLQRIAEYCVQSAHYAARRLQEKAGINLVWPETPFFHEFVIDCGRDAAEVFQDCYQQHTIAPGIALSNLGEEFRTRMLITVTELKTRNDIDALVDAMAEAVQR